MINRGLIRPLIFALTLLGCNFILVVKVSGGEQNDAAYLAGLESQIVFKDGVPNPEESRLEVDLKRVRAIAVDETNTRLQVLAWRVLAAIKDPSQLDFLLDIAATRKTNDYWFNLAGAIRAQVRGPMDEIKLKPLLKDSNRVGELLLVLVDTKNIEILALIFDPKNGTSEFAVPTINEFIECRLRKQLEIDLKIVEPFLKVSCQTQVSGQKRSILNAARLRFPWAASALIGLMIEDHKVKPESKAEREDLEKERISCVARDLKLFQGLCVQDFGDGLGKSTAEVENAYAKCVQWWDSHKADPKYNISK